jgi:hypothetical protein
LQERDDPGDGGQSLTLITEANHEINITPSAGETRCPRPKDLEPQQSEREIRERLTSSRANGQIVVTHLRKELIISSSAERLLA